MNDSRDPGPSVGAAALNTTPLDFERNRTLILEAVAEAKARSIRILCLPELCISGYGCEDAFLRADVRARSMESLEKILPATGGIAVSLGMPLEVQGRVHNAVAFASDGKVLGFVCKQHLASDGIHYEPRWFVAWEEGRTMEISFRGRPTPCGDLTFEVFGKKIGFEICEDAWVQNRPAIRLAGRGVDIILNPSASHFSLKKVDRRRELVLEGSAKFSPVYVYANILGNEAGRIIYDGDTLIAQQGILRTQGRRLSFRDFVLTDASFKPPAWETGPDRDFEEFARGVSLGLFDYLRKSGANGFVLSLSGGADSAAVAVLVRCMCVIGVQELGLDGFKKKLGHIEGLRAATSTGAAVRALLRCVYQATAQSSEKTEAAARSVAAGVEAAYETVSVEQAVQLYLSMFEPALGRRLSWEKDDVTLQNIQARVRSPGIWLLANCTGSILLTTSNRSEAAVGYATMDGDTSGSLAPIAGIDKSFIQRWLSWMERCGLEETGPLPFLSPVTSSEPTAELRPAEKKQTDEADLMPYEVLSAIERLVLCDRMNFDDSLAELEKRFPRIVKHELRTWLEKFERLWRTSQWKRERYAPSFHLDAFNVDPRSWLRYPILSGRLFNPR